MDNIYLNIENNVYSLNNTKRFNQKPLCLSDYIFIRLRNIPLSYCVLSKIPHKVRGFRGMSPGPLTVLNQVLHPFGYNVTDGAVQVFSCLNLRDKIILLMSY